MTVQEAQERFWSEIWQDWFRPLAKDCLKTSSILAVLYLFWEILTWMRFRGYPDEYLQPLEKTHFVFMYCALLVIGSSFVLKLVVSTWSNKRKK